MEKIEIKRCGHCNRIFESKHQNNFCDSCIKDEIDEYYFDSCDDCDLPDACADFGCAAKQGIKKRNIVS